MKILNSSSRKLNVRSDDSSIIVNLNKIINELKSNFITDEGINYYALKESEEFKSYQTLVCDLKHLNLLRMSEIQRKSFFINLYNCLTIHVLIETCIPEKPLQAKGMWTEFAYNVGGYVFTLDDIEHGILRCNKEHPATKKPIFNDDDPRLQFSLNYFDCRIHFALNCGAKSCPPIKIYSADKLNTQLDLAAGAFCNQEISIVNGDDKEIKLSQLFRWYKNDFGGNDEKLKQSLLDYVHSEPLIKALKNPMAKITYQEYDWHINST